MVASESLNAICVDDVTPRLKYDENGRVSHADFFAMRLDHAQIQNLGDHLNLRHLSFAHTAFGDADCVHLRNLSDLTWLSLRCTNVTGHGLVDLPVNALTHLDLFGCQLRKNAYSVLHRFKSLQTLILSRTPIADAELECLRSMTQLRLLYLKYTELTESAIMQLDAAMPNCRVKRFANGQPSARGL